MQKKQRKKRKHVLINKSVELEDGRVQFNGELSPVELDLVLTMGLNYLLANGAIPFSSKKREDVHSNASGFEQ